ncbi:MAG: 3-deoxy-manno-octulosonate-8-phosphatase KdsC [Gammaproteobacteria bacterium]|nr:3-deoxy-manno-octulosonate-8-phosphatase KdsC [Gammaproteobacteria bacterium]MCF6231173.1 3-deoxy-manno-octulosonate-8-phosphatase KdsC [Gammaproteobacteria bacterium]
MQDILERAEQIKLIIFDVDGVLTDGSLFFSDSGEEMKAFNSRDGHGMKMLRESGVEVAIITGRTSNVVTHRMANLGIKYVYQGQHEKLPAFLELIDRLGVTAKQVAYVGDDVVDLPIMRRVGLAVAVQDAHSWVKKHAHWQTPSCGGRGAARDICELIMEAQGSLESTLNQYL